MGSHNTEVLSDKNAASPPSFWAQYPSSNCFWPIQHTFNNLLIAKKTLHSEQYWTPRLTCESFPTLGDVSTKGMQQKREYEAKKGKPRLKSSGILERARNVSRCHVTSPASVRSENILAAWGNRDSRGLHKKLYQDSSTHGVVDRSPRSWQKEINQKCNLKDQG